MLHKLFEHWPGENGRRVSDTFPASSSWVDDIAHSIPRVSFPFSEPTVFFFVSDAVAFIALYFNFLGPGMSILLIPFSFDFVDALCIATVLGFLCESSHKLGRLWNARRGPGGRGSKVAATEATEKDEVGNNLATGRDVQAGIITASDTEVLPGVAERGGLATDTTLFRSDTLFRPKLLPSSASHTEIPGIAPAPTSPRGEHDLAHGKTMPKNAMLPPIEKKRKIKMPRGAPSATYARLSPGSPAKAGPVAVHWGLALAAAAQLMLSVIRDQTYDTSDD